jgi:pyruvate carboxylase subunit B
MVLGYFGKTPAKPDAEIVKLAAQQLGKEPTTEDVHDINDRDPELGIEAARDMLTKNGLETSEENIFIAATCEQKGIDFLKGESPLMQPLKETEIKKQVEKTLKENKKLTEEVVEDLGLASSGASGEPESYTVTVDGKAYHVNVAPGTGEIQNVQAASAASTGGNADGVVITAPMPGTVVRTEVEEGDAISEGDTIVVVESMKMENPIKASVSGVIGELMIKKGDSLSDGDSVARID